MCRLIIIRPSKKNKRNEYFNELVKSLALASYNTNNRDGFGLLSEDNQIFRTLDFKKYTKKIDDLQPQKIVLHLRKATEGEITERNIHFWKFKTEITEFTGAHNGSVLFHYNLATELEDRELYSDSYRFMYEYRHTISNALTYKDKYYTERLLKKAETTKFSGVLFIRDLNNDIEMLMTSRYFTLAKIKIKNELYFVMSSKKDIIENFKSLAGIKKTIKKRWLFYEFEDEVLEPLKITKKTKISYKVIEPKNDYQLWIFTKNYPEKLVLTDKIDSSSYNNGWKYLKNYSR